jgi:DNA-binding Xre family transcriptional regulator
MKEILSVRTRIRVALAKQDKKQAWLADQLGISEASLTRILLGERYASKLVREKVRELTGVWLPKKAEAA